MSEILKVRNDKKGGNGERGPRPCHECGELTIIAVEDSTGEKRYLCSTHSVIVALEQGLPENWTWEDFDNNQ